jgi:hypothetical protein
MHSAVEKALDIKSQVSIHCFIFAGLNPTVIL